MPGGSSLGACTTLFTYDIYWIFNSLWGRARKWSLFCSTSSPLQAGNETRGLVIDYFSSLLFRLEEVLQDHKPVTSLMLHPELFLEMSGSWCIDDRQTEVRPGFPVLYTKTQLGHTDLALKPRASAVTTGNCAHPFWPLWKDTSAHLMAFQLCQTSSSWNTI